MGDWEGNMANDFLPLLSSLIETQEGLAFQGSFKTAKVEEIEFRYFDSNQPNFGLCYSILNNYLLFTTSGGSILKLIDLIRE